MRWRSCCRTRWKCCAGRGMIRTAHNGVQGGTGSCSAIRTATALIVIGVCVLGSSCQRVGVVTIWTAEARSPDGLWLASARTEQHGGPGSAGILTSVYLKRTNVSQPPMEVLGFSCSGPAPRPYRMDNANAGGTINLTMKWVTSSHLDVTYDGHPDLYFQVAKIAGIEISARDLSSATSSVSR
jgi:hypothetical protein